MSLGLRFLLDRDDGHIAVRPSRPPVLARSLTAAQFFLQNPYKPSIKTIAILGGSLGLMSAPPLTARPARADARSRSPLLALFQHLVFRGPFYAPPESPRMSLATLDDAALRQSGIMNDEFWRRRGVALGKGAGADDDADGGAEKQPPSGFFDSLRAAGRGRLQKQMDGRLEDR
jgi:hypothetical protein